MLQVIFDDRLSVPQDIRSTVNVERFGDLVFRRRSWLETMRGLVREGNFPSLVCLRTESDVVALIDSLHKADSETIYLLCVSHLFPSCGHESLSTFLQQVEFAPTPLYMITQDERGRRGWALMNATLLRELFSRPRDENPDIFNPKEFNAEQILGAAKAGGFRGVVIVAKHHDGSCAGMQRYPVELRAFYNEYLGRQFILEDSMATVWPHHIRHSARYLTKWISYPGDRASLRECRPADD